MHDALAAVADAVILRTLHSRFGEALHGSSQGELDALEFLYKSFEGVAGYDKSHADFSWLTAREHFVESFARLALKSQMQVGAHTGKTFSDIHNFIH